VQPEEEGEGLGNFGGSRIQERFQGRDRIDKTLNGERAIDLRT